MGLMVAAAVIGAASAVGDYQSQKAAASAGKEHNKEVVANMVENYHQLAGKEVDTLDASYDASLEAQTQYLQAKAKAQNTAAASGMAGGSVDMLLGDLERQKGAKMAEIIQNREAEFADINSQAKAIHSGANANLVTIKKPNAGSAILTGIKTGLSVYTMGSGALAAYGAATSAGTAGATAATQAATQGAASSVGTGAYGYDFATNVSPYGIA